MSAEVDTSIHSGEETNLLAGTDSQEPRVAYGGADMMLKEEGEGEEGGAESGGGSVNGLDSESDISLLDVHNYKPGENIQPYLPGLGIIATVSEYRNPARREGPQFKITLEHGPFEWTVYKHYREFLALRRALQPMRMRVRRRIPHGRRASQYVTLPHLLTFTDVNPRGGIRIRNQVPKVQRLMNAVLHDRQFRTHVATYKFLEISRLSFVDDLGKKLKESSVVKRSGGHHRVTNCLGCHACCVCRCSVWRERWFVLKDNFIAYLRANHAVGGVLLFDEGMVVEAGIRQTGIQNGLRLNTQSRDLLVKCGSQKQMREWRNAIQEVVQGSGSVWVEKKRFDSFAPLRANSSVKWFVDAEGFMSCVADAFMAAKEEIFITDWMISPHIFLKRDMPHSLEWRMDKLLLKKATEGVRVFIQLYKEFELAILLGGEFASELLAHPNIVVFRHPDHVAAGVYLWAHHEKIVVIDQTLAFVGGIDLAFGRWDNARHVLHDQGQPPKQELVSHALKSAFTVAIGSDGSSPEPHDGADGPLQQWVGKDYYNPFIKDFIELEQPYADQLNRGEHIRMPWHDIGSCVYGPAARDVGRHFIQRHNFTKHEQAHRDIIPFLLPRQSFNDDELLNTKYLHDLFDSMGPNSTNADVQILRSSGPWSAGLRRTEHSILNAYLIAIEHAEHFIFIENQFFISSLPKDDVENGIVEALRKRIVRAYSEGKTFRVIVVMPLMPSFEGEFGTASGTILEAVIHWNYRTISREEDSLIGRLIHEDHIPINEVNKFFSVYGLRTHGMLEGKLVTEIVYVHSKCMIVDDRLTIIGSANVNDRSQLGDRDSEVAIIVDDKELVDGKLNGESYQVGKFSHSLRCHLFREHLGLLEGQVSSPNPDLSVEDPVCDKFYEATWMKAAESNTSIYEQVFGGRALPSDSVKNYEQLKNYQTNPGYAGRDLAKAQELLSQLQGTLVQMPLLFLQEEDLLPDIGTKEFFAPEVLVK